MSPTDPTRSTPVWRPIARVGVILGLLLATLTAQTPEELQARLQSGDADGVLTVVRGLARADKMSAEQALVGALAALELGAWNDARSFADHAEHVLPNDPRPRAMNGHALFGMGEASASSTAPGGGGFARATFFDAAQAYRQSRERGGDVFTMAYFEAESLLYAEDPNGAIVAIKVALEADPQSVSARLLHGRACLGAKKPEDAILVLETAKKKDPTHRDVTVTLLRACLSTDDRARAREVFLDTIRAFPKDRDLYDPFFQKYRAERPDTFLRETLLQAKKQTTPERDRFPHWYLGVLAQAQGRDEEALSEFLTYRDALPTTPEGPYRVGLVLTSLGRLAEAREELKRADALGGLSNEDIAFAYGRLTAAFVNARDYESASHTQRVVIAATNHDPLEEISLGVLLIGAGLAEDGVAVYQRVRSRKDLTPAVAVRADNYCALGLLGLGKKAEAEECLRAALATEGSSLGRTVDLDDAAENLGVLLIEQGRADEGRALLESVVSAQELSPPRSKDRARYHLMRARYPAVLGLGSRASGN